MSVDYLDVLYACGPYIAHSSTKRTASSSKASLKPVYQMLLGVAKRYYAGEITKSQAKNGINTANSLAAKLVNKVDLSGVDDEYALVESYGLSYKDISLIERLLDDLGNRITIS